MKKRRLLALFAATAVLAGTMLAVGCGKDSEPSASEKYTGVVSTQSYTNTESAASACIATEVSGEDYQVTYERYEKEATLTESEVTALNISSEVNGTVESVEKGKIYFSEVSAANAIATAAGEVDLYITVYIIKYTPQGTSVSEYKYVVPLPANNEVLTYSYYDSVMNPDNYKNCTMNAKISMSVKYGGQTESSSTSYTMQITETAAKLNMSVPTEFGTIKTTLYLADTANGLGCAMEMSYGGEKMCVPISATELGFNANSVSQLYSSNLSEAQYSLFVKTSSGFKMRDEAVTALIDSTFDAIFSEMGLGNNVQWNTNKAVADYKVVDGKLYKATADLGITVAVTDGVQSEMMTLTSKTVITYTNYGTTTVTISNDAKDVLGIN